MPSLPPMPKTRESMRSVRMTTADLEEAHGEAYDRIAAKSARVDFIHIPLLEEGFDDEDDGP